MGWPIPGEWPGVGGATDVGGTTSSEGTGGHLVVDPRAGALGDGGHILTGEPGGTTTTVGAGGRIEVGGDEDDLPPVGGESDGESGGESGGREGNAAVGGVTDLGGRDATPAPGGEGPSGGGAGHGGGADRPEGGGADEDVVGTCAQPLDYTIGDFVRGSTEGRLSNVSGASCVGSNATSRADVVYQFSPERDGPVCLSLGGSTFDTLLVVRQRECSSDDAADEVDCNDNAPDIAGGTHKMDSACILHRYYSIFQGY